MSAALLASLFTAVVAGPASAAVTATSVGTFAINTTSTGTLTLTFTERSAAPLANAAGSLLVTICDSSIAPAACVGTTAAAAHVSFSGTPSTAGSTGSLGASASVAGNVLTVSWTASDTANLEEIDVTGLKIAASSLAVPGPVKAVLSGANVANFFAAPTTVTASGTIQATDELLAGADTADISLTSVCPFVATGGVTSQASFSVVTDARNVTAVGVPAGGIQSVTFAAGTVPHLAGITVSQTAAYCGSSVLSDAVGTIANALGYASAGNPNVFPGESNSPAANLTLTEPIAGFLVNSTTVTLTINTVGVLFSTRPVANVTSGNLVLSSAIGAPVNEVQTITLGSVSGADTFSLTYGAFTTAAIPATADGTAVDTALSTGAGSIPAADVTVTGAVGGPYTVTFTGALAATNVAQLVPAVVADPVVVGFTVVAATIVQGGSSVASAVTLSADRKSASFSVTSTGASTVASTILISNIFYDVASTVAGGTFVDVTVTAGGLLVNPTHRTNAVVGRGLTATATPTTVFIGQNAQKSGLTTITELAAGFFQGGTGSNNTIQVCLINNAETFTSPGPWAKVTAGDLKLREGNVVSPDNIVPGTAVFFASTGDTCYTWTVWTASTAVSTIVIGNSDFSSGPLIDVPANSVPGAVNMAIFVGNGAVIPNTSAVAATVQIATAVFQNQVVVTALSQPTIPVGSNGSPAGNIRIQETASGQLKLNEEICVEILPNQNEGTLYDAFLKGLNTADVPMVTSSNGILTGPVSFSNQRCLGTLAGNPGTLAISFSFLIQQQSVGGNGTLDISNIKYATVNDAVVGPVQVNVYGLGLAPTTVQFQSLISNARIGSAQVGAMIAVGNNIRDDSLFSLNTAITKQNARVTLRFAAPDNGTGALVTIWVKTKTTAWKVETHRRITGDGFAYYSPKVLNKGYRYYRVVVTSNTSNTVRAFGK